MKGDGASGYLNVVNRVRWRFDRSAACAISAAGFGILLLVPALLLGLVTAGVGAL